MSDTDTKPFYQERLEEIVFTYGGMASVCWESMEGTGVFQSDRAKEGGDEAVARIVGMIEALVATTADHIEPDATAYVNSSLSIWTSGFSAQIRDNSLAFHVMDDAERSTEDGHPAIFPLADARRLRDLLNLAHFRGRL